jgi:hypothetical protein
VIQILRLSAFGVALALVSAFGHLDVVLAQSARSAAPPVVRVGDPSIDGAFLKPYKNAWKVVYEFPGKEPLLVGTWSDELAPVEVNGLHLLKRTQLADYA